MHSPLTIDADNGNELDAEQHIAASALDGPVVIVAGPGSGKTRVLVERMLRLIDERSIPPERILAITFTNKAANEMRSRMRAVLTSSTLPSRIGPWIGTFHALAHEIVREHGARIGIPSDFVLVETHTAKKLTSRARRQKMGKDNSTLDFDTLLTRALELLHTDDEVLAHYRRRFNFLLADEYQDTSPVQSALLDLLAEGHRNLCVIGDPNQAIYSFRGADPEHFATFTERYPDARVLRLTTNYRSTPAIVGASTALVKKSWGIRCSKITTGIGCPKTILTHTATDRAEAAWIVRTIEREIGGADLLSLGTGAFSFGDFAVIYRLHAAARVLESAFAYASIPFRTIGGTGFFEQPEIRAVLKSIQNLGASAVQKFSKFSEVVHAAVGQLAQIKRPIQEPELNAADSHMKRDRLSELEHIAEGYDTMPLAQASHALLTRAALARPEDDHVSGEAVTLLTAHAAKGLEFAVVFVVGVEEGLFPYLRPDESGNAERVAEERRLLYVAMTRAKERLFLSHAARRTLHGKTYASEPSRFLRDIPGSLIDRVTVKPPKIRPASPQARLF